MTWEEIKKNLEEKDDQLRYRVLPDAIAHAFFGDPEEVRRKHHEQREQTAETFEECIGEIRSEFKDCPGPLIPAMEQGGPLDVEPENAVSHIDGVLNDLSALRETIQEKYLTEDEAAELREYEKKFEQASAFVETKTRFEKSIEPLEVQFDRLENDIRPYTNYEQYLTRHAKQDLEERADAIQTEVTALRQQIDESLLAPSDVDRLNRIETTLDEIDHLLPTYNKGDDGQPGFVDKQIAACEDLFTDIDDAGHDLNRAQCEAVVRNDTYNQVIAAAGTGKTFALTYRVAYLVDKQDVDPDRITALTYTREAAQEMKERLESQFGITEVDVSTIHSFGYGLAQEASEEHLTTPDSRDLPNLIEDVIREETNRQGGQFRAHYEQFLYHYKDDYLNEADFESKSDYIAERAAKDYETLAGETVASRAEKTIADFLFTHQVTYQYESVAEWADVAADKGAYRPDFYLPEYDLYIEHWGIDENAEVASWFSWSSEEYLGKLRWARGEFEQADRYRLIDTYEFEHAAGWLESALEHRLSVQGVDLNRMSFEDLVDSAFEYHEKERDIVSSFGDFVRNAKTFNIAPDEIEERLDPSNPRQYHFCQCGRTVLQEYNEFLNRNRVVDFDDMIYDAITAVSENPEYHSRYDHLLVDEFQDVSMSQIRLIRQLSGPDRAKLFCVGDDWQSIYSFQGSEVSYFVDFEEHFGTATQTYLIDNYRCPETVLEAGNSLIRNNDDQIDKTVRAGSGRDTDPKCHTLDGYHDSAYQRRVVEYAADLVEQYLDQGSDPSDVMVLCRYDGAAPYIPDLKDELEKRDIPYDGKDDEYRPRPSRWADGDGVAAFSVHQSKGREAAHVILLHAAQGYVGFPPDRREDDLIAPVQDVPTNTTAEERRLFYVAITRAEESLDVLTRRGEESPFVEEIEEYMDEVRSVATLDEVGETTDVTAKVNTLFENVHEKQRQAGVLSDPTGTVKFVSWESSDPPTVEEDVWYRFEGVEIDEFNDDTQVILRHDTSVTNLYRDGDVYVGSATSGE